MDKTAKVSWRQHNAETDAKLVVERGLMKLPIISSSSMTPQILGTEVAVRIWDRNKKERAQIIGGDYEPAFVFMSAVAAEVRCLPKSRLRVHALG